MKSDKTLRILLIVTLGVFVVQFLNYFTQLSSLVFSKPENPLIPKYIWKYAAFNLSVISLVMLALSIYAYSNMRKMKYALPVIYTLFLSAASLCFFGDYLYQLVNSFNPYV